MGSNFRFVHCADLHLGSRFRGVSSADPVLGRRMRESTMESFRSIVDLTIREGADALIISGDVYDDENLLPSTRNMFIAELRRLKVPVFICRGNHDSRTRWEGSLPYPENVHEFGTEPESIIVEARDGRFEVVGVSFSESHETRNLAASVRGRPDMFTVACVHCDVDSASEGYSYAPCRMIDLQGKGVDYWALGHIHKRQVLSEGPFVVYPGNIQGRSGKETGEKGAYLVTVASGVVSELRFVPTQGILWREVRVDVTGKDLRQVFEEAKAQVGPGDMARIVLEGSGELDGLLRSEEDPATLFSGLGCTVSSVEVGTSPSADYGSGTGSDMVSAIVRTSGDLSESDRSMFLSIIEKNRNAARHTDYFESLSDEQIRSIIDDAAKLLVTRMGASR